MPLFVSEKKLQESFNYYLLSQLSGALREQGLDPTLAPRHEFDRRGVWRGTGRTFERRQRDMRLRVEFKGDEFTVRLAVRPGLSPESRQAVRAEVMAAWTRALASLGARVLGHGEVREAKWGEELVT